MRQLIVLMLGIASVAVLAADWSEYQQSDLNQLVSISGETSSGNTYLPISKYLVKVKYGGKTRALTQDIKAFLNGYQQVYHYPDEIKKYNTEVLFLDGATSYWIPTQDVLIPHIKKEVKAGDVINLYLYRTGAKGNRWIFLVNEFTKDDERLD